MNDGAENLVSLTEARPQKIEVDIIRVKEKAILGYHTLTSETPQLVPWSDFATQVAHSDSEIAPLFNSIISNAHRMIDINGLSWVGKAAINDQPSHGSGGYMEQWRRDQVTTIAENLANIGITLTPETLEASLPRDKFYREIHNRFFSDGQDPDEGLLEILLGIQREMVGIAHATRVYEEARIIMEACVPNIPWPKKQAIYFTSNRQDRGFEENGGWIPRVNGGGHILVLIDPLGDLDTYIRGLSRKDLTLVRQDAGKLIYAVHEAGGHGGFAELFDDGAVQDVFGYEKRLQDAKEVRLADSLTEGYAILMEQLAAEASYSERLGKGKEWVDRGLDRVRERRVEGLLKKRRDPKLRLYSDGFIILRRLMRQMGIYDLSNGERINKLRDFLRAVDLRVTARMKPQDEEYQAILRDPLNRLPKKQEQTNQV